MEIVYKKIEDLKPYENNPRYNDEAVQYVAKSIEDFGFKVPLVIDKNNTIVAGHTRYKASLELGLEEVPCIVADDLDEDQIKAFRLVDNKVAEKADWNFELLNDELNDLDLDLSLYGFEIVDNIDFEELDLKEKDNSINYFDKEEIKQDIVNYWSPKTDLKEFVKDIIDVPTAKYQFNRLCQGYKDGYNISLLFNPHRLNCETYRNKSIYYGLVNDKKFREHFARFMIEMQNKVVVQSDYHKFLGIGMANYQYVNEFQPYLARDIYKKYCKEGDKILNPCAGWGGRLIGLASCLFKNIEYVETDPSTETYKGLVELKKFLRLGDNYKQYNLPFEDLQLKENYFDFTFTSPPYFDTEIYSREDTQSCIKNNDYEMWRDNFLYIMIDKIVYSLKKGGVCILNVGNKRYPVSNDIKEYLKSNYNIEVNKENSFKLDNNEETEAIRSSEEDFLIFRK